MLKLSFRPRRFAAQLTLSAVAAPRFFSNAPIFTIIPIFLLFAAPTSRCVAQHVSIPVPTAPVVKRTVAAAPSAVLRNDANRADAANSTNNANRADVANSQYDANRAANANSQRVVVSRNYPNAAVSPNDANRAADVNSLNRANAANPADYAPALNVGDPANEAGSGNSANIPTDAIRLNDAIQANRANNANFADAANPANVPAANASPQSGGSSWNDPWFGSLGLSTNAAPNATPSNAAHSHLLALSWLVGAWELRANGQIFLTKIDWAPGESYLVCRDFVRPLEPLDGNPDATPTFAALRVIGWNPMSGLFQSSIFCRDGSAGTAIWQENDGVWTVSTRLVTAGGRVANSVEYFRPAAPSGFVWEATSRTFGDASLPNVGPAQARPISPEIFERIVPSLLPESAEAATME